MLPTASFGQPKVTPSANAISIQPFRDGVDGFPLMANVVYGASSFVHVVAWGFDNEMRWTAIAQRPLEYYSRRNPNPPTGARSADIDDCDYVKPGNPLFNKNMKRAYVSPFDDSLITLLRCKAADLALAAEATQKPKSVGQYLQYGEVMVLAWNQTLDLNNYQPPLNNMDDIAYVYVPSTSLLLWNDDQLHDEMRRRGSGESMLVLLAFQNYYKTLQKAGTQLPHDVIMPTGIMIMTQNNKNNALSSHHQKLIITDEGAFVGGLNTFKEYWDTHDHATNDGRRWMSGLASGPLTSLPVFTIPSPNESPPPALHDTGSILKGTAIVSRINNTFLARWDSNIQNWNGVADHLQMTKLLPSSVQSLLAHFEQSSPYFTLEWRLAEQVLAMPHAPTGATANLIDELEKFGVMRKPKGTIASAADPNYIVTNSDFRVSHPSNSYNSGEGPAEIRDKYEALIASTLDKPGTFGYFENQYVQDYEIAQKLFDACTPKWPSDPQWCPRDPYVHFVVPFEPGGAGVPLLDRKYVVPEMVFREFQLFTWLEVKTATRLIDRNSGVDVLYIRPPKPALCPCEAGTQPDIKFVDQNAQKSPDGVTPDSEIEATGFDPTKPCVPPALNTNSCFQPLAKRWKVKDIITDGAIRSYALVNGYDANGVDVSSFQGSTPVQRYNNYLENYFIYVHSKHSEIFGKLPTGALQLTYAVGSANLNARSLGNTALNTDANDSEDEVFWTPADDKFWRQVWQEHSNISFTTNLSEGAIDAAQDWANQGWQNWQNVRGGTKLKKGEHVIRLDAYARCVFFHGSAKDLSGKSHSC